MWGTAFLAESALLRIAYPYVVSSRKPTAMSTSDAAQTKRSLVAGDNKGRFGPICPRFRSFGCQHYPRLGNLVRTVRTNSASHPGFLDEPTCGSYHCGRSSQTSSQWRKTCLCTPTILLQRKHREEQLHDNRYASYHY
jgi:hypothetical protein